MRPKWFRSAAGKPNWSTCSRTGYKNKEIAYTLGISEGTIKVYLSKLYRKLGVKDRYELALYGLRSGNLTQLGFAHPSQPRRGPQAAVKSPVLVLDRTGSGRMG
jgi:hypothetical protein